MSNPNATTKQHVVASIQLNTVAYVKLYTLCFKLHYDNFITVNTNF